MATLKLEIDQESLARLAELAVDERRPLVLEAEVLLLRALGRWPVPAQPNAPEAQSGARPARSTGER